MSEERRKILEMLSAGKITVDEAERLMAAIGSETQQTKNAGSSAQKGYKYLRVLVEPSDSSRDGDRVNIRIPMNLIRAGLKWMSFIPKEAQGKVSDALKDQGIDVDLKRMRPEDLEELIENLNDMQVEVDGKDKVRVFCE